MRKNSKVAKRMSLILLMALASICLASCGSSNEAPESTQEADQKAAADSSGSGDEAAGEKEETSPDEKKDEKSSLDPELQKTLGEWELIYSDYSSDYSDGETYDYITMCTDPDSPSSSIRISERDGKPVIDYKYSAYETQFRYYGMELEYNTGAAYDGCKNTGWYLELRDPLAEDEKESQQDVRKITMIDDDTLIMVEEYESEEGEDSESYFHSVNVSTYIKKDSPRLDNKEELRYFDTVTVSDTTELLNSIQNNRKIILKEGEYKLSEAQSKEIDNKNVEFAYGGYKISNVSNLCLEAEDGSDVTVLIDEPYEPVLSFNYGNNITLRGLTAGHDVEKGYCSGSVLYFSGVTGITIDKCHLYGSGTYGIETESSSYLDVTDTEIYECTYGLVSLYSTSTARFKNCTMRDSEDMSMIVLNSAYDIIFEDCVFSGNVCSYEENCFIQKEEYDDITFKGCEFKDNKYYIFSNHEVKMEDCKMNNNDAKYSDIINFREIDDGSDLLKLYDDVKQRQDEIDKKLKEDDLLDQATLNQLAYEEFDMWDSLLNRVWAFLGRTLDESAMETLTAEQKEWIKSKEAAQNEAGKDFEGGSMQPMILNSVGAEKTRKRVETLMDKYIKQE